jgi:pimeloyl-ACP methyl ester carboxylesterase
VYALERHVDDLAALIVELELGPAHVVGHSYGGYVGLGLGLAHPELVRSLILGEPPVLPLLSRTSVGEALGESFDRRVFRQAREAYERGKMKEGLRRFLDGVIYPGWFEGLPPEAQDDRVRKAGPEHRLEVLTEPSVYMPPVACNALTSLDRPTLLMTGEDSDVRFLLITAELEECLEGESHVMVPGVAHGMFSNVSFTHEAILAFLRDR